MNKDILTYLLPILATIFSVIVGIINIISMRKMSKEKRKKTEIHFKTDKTFLALQKALMNTKSLNNDEIFKDINIINNKIKIIFDDLTMSSCRSTIRTIVYDDNVPMLVSLMSQSIKNNTKSQMEFKKTKLFEDITMSLLFHKQKDYYLNNDIEINTFLPVVPKSDKDSEWKFIYLSSLVVPITKIEKNVNKNFIYGFLCLDSDKKNAFNKETHIKIAKQISFDLLPLLESWTKKMIEKNNDLLPVVETLELETGK